MKKYLFLVLSILSIFFITDRVDALSFTLNGLELEVTEENYLFYTYYSKPELFDEYNYFFVGYSSWNNVYEVFFSNYKWFYNGFGYKYSFGTVVPYYVLRYNTSFSSYTVSSSSSYKNYNGADLSTLLYSNYDINDSSNTVVFSSNITKQDLVDYFGAIYNLNFYVDNELYKTYEVYSNSSFDISQVDYIPSKNYKFNGWDLDGIDLSCIRSDINIYGTTSYVRPNMNYSENIDSVIHELSVSIIGKNVPVEFDYVYTVMDYIILIVLVLCVISPFVIIIKLLSGR